ncbi:putative HTH-type transcriptional regulator TtgW [Mycobacteroides salmoniphilum]|uniref:Putative HTH-type transcriptional regulator TtgW n=1 Tax=Mycobacteroides salmoniphilum TaxID=404941 RepID=A0A4R8SUA4_9MYCO|nr:putative HTH-type transcriptional regulator TtgW [Mycobacteroides salmoniphilum]TEA04052.1 putative HTH-type transcriptional regulator TtgW [Mycobacteroides salmoniphilum]
MSVPRKDALANRERLIAAAREAFSERGLDATLDDIAARAGLGTGTAYRHFRDKHALASEVLSEATEQIAKDARAALTIADPWQALATFCERIGARHAANRGLYEALSGKGRSEDKERIWPQIVQAVTQLVERARSAGIIRADAQPEDVGAILTMLGPVYPMGQQAWRRYLTLMLDGLRAVHAPPLPVPAPRLSSLDDLTAANGDRRP